MTRDRDSRARAGAGATGASAGTILVVLAKSLPEHKPWTTLAVLVAPSLSVVFSWLLVRLRRQFEYRFNELERDQPFKDALARIDDIIENSKSEGERAFAQKQREEIVQHWILAKRKQLQFVLKEVP